MPKILKSENLKKIITQNVKNNFIRHQWNKKVEIWQIYIYKQDKDFVYKNYLIF